MNLNLFRVLSPAEQEAMQQFIDYDVWRLQCMALGATDAQLGDYERSARAFALTTVYPNDAIIATARKAAKEALLRGEPMPQDAEREVQRQFARELAWLIGWEAGR